ncbi:hypothetical protein HYH03_013599 [Edaphochlamys debaryana]|uniref:Uncharacterized protein n=1 Tax=Edaphochlamys debaryana TaxID=47281 RepID=A0A835XQC2_9CHLO|nr:hypothetical protein HYH03_013599 [Edaphochlamys debaryana]|eukprot:KAG2487754.1 hypothetical protein HYH03_013599 [Edaphochlamys debaryana]
MARELSGFDLIYLEHIAETRAGQPVLTLPLTLTLTLTVHRSVYPRGTAAYMISGRGAYKLLQHFETHPSSMPIDETLGALINAGKVSAYSVFPAVMTQSGAPSTIFV